MQYQKLYLHFCEVDLEQCLVITKGQKNTKISELEKSLLLYFVANANRTITRDELLEKVWQVSGSGTSRVVDQAVKQLRKKIGESSSKPKMLFSIYGKGYRCVVPKQPEAAPRPMATSNVTESLSHICGRENELRTITHFFQEKGRLLTILGMGGMGKTTIAKEYAKRARSSYQYMDGIFFCDLAESRNQLELLQTVAATLQLQLPASADLQHIAQSIGNSINQLGECLIILDNFEQLASHTAQTIADWYDQTEKSHFLITSRQRLGLLAEHIFELPPFSEEEALIFFNERIQALRVGYQANETETAVIRKIVKNLDYIPLAIQLAASRSRVLSVQQISKRLQDRFKLLRKGSKPQAERHATMKATIDWSWDLLSPTERSILQQCSVFRGGFDLEAAEQIITLDNTEDLWLEDILQALVDKSMLLIRRSNEQQEHRIAVFDSIRFYAAEKLKDLGDIETTRQNHSDYYLQWIRTHNDLSDPAALQHLSFEVDNIQAVWERIIPDDPTTAAEITIYLSPFFELKGWYASLLQMFTALQKQSITQDTLDLLHYRVSRVLYRLQDFQQISQLLKDGQHIQAESVRLDVQFLLANVHLAQKNFEAAEQICFSVIDTQHYEAQAPAWMILSGIYHQQYQYQKSLGCSEKVLDIYERLNHSMGRLKAMGNLASDLMLVGDLEQAEIYLLKAIESNRSFQNRYGEALNLLNLSTLLLYLHTPEESLQHSKQSMAILQELGQADLEILALSNHAVAQEMLGNTTLAIRTLERAEQIGSDPTYKSIARALLIAIRTTSSNADLAMWSDAIEKLQTKSQISSQSWHDLGTQFGKLYTAAQQDQAGDSFAAKRLRSEVSRFIRQPEMRLQRTPLGTAEEVPPGHHYHDQFVLLIERSLGENFWKRHQKPTTSAS